ncbi:hypothetical protein N510_003290 [Firmicutes bacterium ASF500]|nr:hypothetical protein N510_003290 [Firmicutes bacterium ASF500]
MKKYIRPLGAALVLALLAAGAYAVSADDSLISLSYLRDTFFPKAVQTGGQSADQALQGVYESALDELDAIHSAAVNGVGGGSGDGYYSDTLQSRSWSDGQIISLPTGSGFLMLDGAAMVIHSGAVVDTTDGAEMASGSVLRYGHRYLVGEDTTAQVTVFSGQARLGVQGGYALSPGRGQHTPFFDVNQNDWFYAPVNYAYERGLFSGMDENHFDPGGSMNRAMLMSVLHRLAGSPSDGGALSFADVPDGQWYSQAVRWGAAQGITSGTGEGIFSPFNQVTREQTVVMLYNYTTKYLKRGTGAVANLSDYQDLDRVSDWARPAMAWAVGQGIVSGVNNGGRLTLEPQRGATRAEMATMLQAFSEKIL